MNNLHFISQDKKEAYKLLINDMPSNLNAFMYRCTLGYNHYFIFVSNPNSERVSKLYIDSDYFVNGLKTLRREFDITEKQIDTKVFWSVRTQQGHGDKYSLQKTFAKLFNNESITINIIE